MGVSEDSMSGKKKLKTQELRNLDLEIGFLEGIVRRDPDYLEALQILGDDYTKRGRFQEGLQVDERLLRLCPNDPLVLYNLACSYSLTGHCGQAAQTLTTALERGYEDLKWLAKDPDLDNLRKDPCWQELKARIQSLKTKTG